MSDSYEDEAGFDSNPLPILLATLDSPRKLLVMLKAVHLNEKATCVVSERGLRFTVNDKGSAQTSAFVKADLFDEYECRSKCDFAINLDVLIECLSIFGATTANSQSTSLRICYPGYGNPLELKLAERNVCTTCNIHTMEGMYAEDMNFRGSEVYNKVILQAEALRPIFSEMTIGDKHGQFDVYISAQDPCLRFSTSNVAGSCEVSFPPECEVVESLESVRTQSGQYLLSSMRHCLKAMSVASKVSMRMNARGFLSLQFMIEHDVGQQSFVEYWLVPDVEAAEEYEYADDDE
ncbi:hypothetical protein SARC_04837 [Sphaeroforma arctica JP610]|uniref:Cell cycle checkpoint protein RAD1 n=1 Tax=Sphaeroforma arctica JP610 TaxID=667725 RepID=A0A0L0G230_9EUKA|nr:hypothetical protein SARC_04837 [Sphaeroforma arctica JP610]KNC82894.1 hypothetical protein SARC_04837 [Sphaeroforma arctica JP610]|eukprot:XP_014156796.1 hypothetical protein SARC_04837 [Sphaeroforma arctica JP610]